MNLNAIGLILIKDIDLSVVMEVLWKKTVLLHL